MNLMKGQILTSHWHDDSQGLSLIYYLTDGMESFKVEFTAQSHVFFIDQQSNFSPPCKFERKNGGLKNFSHKNVDTIYLKNYRDLKTIKDYCENNSVRTYELDIMPTERFLMERFIFGQMEVQGEFQTKNGIKTFYNPQIRPSHFPLEFSHLSLDIETGVKGELYSIGLYYKNQFELKKIVLMVGPTEQSQKELIFFKHEKELLTEFYKIFNSWDPDLIIGWHVIGFDFKFLESKFQKYQIPFQLGRDNSLLKIDERKGVGFFAECRGRVVVDGPPTLRSAFYKFKNFKLETVASSVLDTSKDIASDSGKVDEIERRFKEDKLALAKYNLLDCKLVTDIFEKLNIFNFLIERSKISGLLIDRLNISTAAFDFSYLPYLHRKKYVAPNRIDIIRDEGASGGLVLSPKEGRHNNIAVFDFKSLYPTLIQTFKIDPYARIMYDKEGLKTPKGFEFSSTEHILPNIIAKLMERRQLAKQNHNASLSQAVKILMNSFYGIMGSSRSRFYHSDLPEAITSTGHWILKSTMDFLANHNFETIYGDTDSLFVQMPNRDEKACTQLADKITEYLKNLIKTEFKLESFLECEFEKQYDQIFFGKMRHGDGAAKKRYVGVENNQLEFKGMEFVRSDWTELAKDFQKELFEKYFDNAPIEDFIKGYISNLEAGIFDEKLVYTKRLSKDPKEYVKNIPIHVKAALKIDHQGPYRLKEVSYVITPTGPEPTQHDPRKFDYSHYIEKQLKPIADDILITQNSSFDSFISGDQLSFDL